MNRTAYVEAADQLSAALELLRSQTDDLERDRIEIAIRFSLDLCVGIGVGDLRASTNALERARELSEKLSVETTLFEVLSLLAFTYSVKLDHQKASAFLRELWKSE
jgi:hypothetical protein